MPRTFADDLREEFASPDDIEDYIQRWRGTEGVELHEFLGLTADEYKRWNEGGRLPHYSDHEKACGAPAGARWGYLPCGCTHDGYGGHLR